MKVLYTDFYQKWFKSLKDPIAKASIAKRLNRITVDDHLGDYKSVGDEVYEMRIFIKSGIRLYFIFDGDKIIILLCGGDKDTQTKDIAKAKEILKELK